MKTKRSEAAIRVAIPVIDHGIPVCSEALYALPDPAHPDQAVVANVPVLAAGVNYGDIVRLGSEDESGVRPVTEVVLASGHVHMLAAAPEGEAHELVAELERTFPAYGLRIQKANETVISVSVHPDLCALDVRAAIGAWLGDGAELAAVAEPSASACGPLTWA